METQNKPLYAIIIEYIQRQIEEGQFVPHEQIPTEMELAQQFGVSRITTKRALVELERSGYIYRKRGSGSYVRERQDSSEVQDRESKEMIPAKNIISIVLPYMVENGHVGYIKGISDYLEATGYYLSLHSTDWNPERERELLNRLPKHGFVGIILYPVSTIYNQDIIHMHHLNGYPLVAIDQFYDGVPVPSVVSDNRNGSYMAARHLIEQGHRRVAYVSSIGIQYRNSVRDRYFGYFQALKDFGLPLDSELVVTDFYRELTSENTHAYYEEVARSLMTKGVTAIMMEHDQLALDMMAACYMAGIKVPEQLSIIGFDDIELAQHGEPPLTTIAQDFYEVGKYAAELMVAAIEKRSDLLERPMPLIVPVEMKMRQSTSAVD